MKSSASANWKGTGKEGIGTISTEKGVLKNVSYDYKSRFEVGNYTNPEEMIAAAHSSCFSMKLSFVLGAAGFTPSNIDTKCTVTLEGGAVTESHLDVKATVPGITTEKFAECAADAKANCPISKLLNTNITMQASLA
ncbi:MAG TPA: OsmC family protein [Chitinophagaceae bacterium]|nr:OsmC family protein [Chitinophagaceae bacterium]